MIILNFYILCLLLVENEVYEILKIGYFINNIFKLPLRESSFTYFIFNRAYGIHY